MAAADGSAVPEEKGAVDLPAEPMPEFVMPAESVAEEKLTREQIREMSPEDRERYLREHGIEPWTLEPDKPEAALTEKSETNHKVTYKVGESDPLEFHLPPKLHASVMFRAGVLRDDDGQGAARLIQSVLGAEQFEAVMDKMDAEGLTIDDEIAMTSIGNLLNDALATYGVSPGESQASPKS